MRFVGEWFNAVLARGLECPLSFGCRLVQLVVVESLLVCRIGSRTLRLGGPFDFLIV